MIWLHIMPAMLFVKTKCRDKSVDGGLSNMVSLLYAVGISVGETGGSYIAGTSDPTLHFREQLPLSKYGTCQIIQLQILSSRICLPGQY